MDRFAGKIIQAGTGGIVIEFDLVIFLRQHEHIKNFDCISAKNENAFPSSVRMEHFAFISAFLPFGRTGKRAILCMVAST